MPRHLVKAEASLASRGIMDDELVACDFSQHHKVIQIPMQNGRQAQFAEFIKFKPHRAGAKLFLFSNACQRSECDAFERDRMATAQGGQISQRPVPAKHHGQTGEPALRAFGLVDDWQSATDAKRESLHQIHRCHFPEMLYSGSSSHS